MVIELFFRTSTSLFSLFDNCSRSQHNSNSLCLCFVCFATFKEITVIYLLLKTFHRFFFHSFIKNITNSSVLSQRTFTILIILLLKELVKLFIVLQLLEICTLLCFKSGFLMIPHVSHKHFQLVIRMPLVPCV